MWGRGRVASQLLNLSLISSPRFFTSSLYTLSSLLTCYLQLQVRLSWVVWTAKDNEWRRCGCCGGGCYTLSGSDNKMVWSCGCCWSSMMVTAASTWACGGCTVPRQEEAKPPFLKNRPTARIGLIRRFLSGSGSILWKGVLRGWPVVCVSISSTG